VTGAKATKLMQDNIMTGEFESTGMVVIQGGDGITTPPGSGGIDRSIKDFPNRRRSKSERAKKKKPLLATGSV
jgi:hypothetical protein